MTNGTAPCRVGVASSPGVDLQQISAVGTITTIGPGGEAGALRPAGGGGALHPAGGGGALRPAGGGGALRPAGGGGLTGEITHEGANSYARPPDQLFDSQAQLLRAVQFAGRKSVSKAQISAYSHRFAWQRQTG